MATTPGAEPTPGASGSQEAAAKVLAQNPTVSELSTTAPLAKDIPAEEATRATSERTQVYKDLLPKLVPYGIVDTTEGEDTVIPQKVLLLEPAGTTKYVLVTNEGTYIASQLEDGTINPSNVNLRNIQIDEEATTEEAMQALQRSITRVESGLYSSPAPVPAEYGIKPYSLGEKIIAKLGINPEAITPHRHQPLVVNTETLAQSDLEHRTFRGQIARLREGYKRDSVPSSYHPTFQEVVKLDQARRDTPNKFVHDLETERITTAKAMSALTEIRQEGSTQAVPSPTSGAK